MALHGVINGYDFSSWTIPIVYDDGHVGYANKATYERLLDGTYKIEGLTMARPKKASPKLSGLTEAINFVSVAGTKDLQDYNKFVNLKDKFAVMSDGQITAGHPIEEELTLVANMDLLQKALKKCGKSISITELDTNRLSITGDKLRAIVPCITQDKMPTMEPDAPVCPIDDRLKHAFACCGVLASENGERLLEASLLLEANVCTGSNGKIIMQYWHGISLPYLVIPKIFAAAVVKVQKPLQAFGLTQVQMDNGEWQTQSITFHFEGGSWLKTVCYSDKWPDVNPILNNPSYPAETPPDFFDGCEIVSEFTNEGYVLVTDDRVMSHKSDDVGAQYEVNGAKGDKIFFGKNLKLIAPFAKTIDFTTYQDRAFFFMDQLVRGVVIAVRAGG